MTKRKNRHSQRTKSKQKRKQRRSLRAKHKKRRKKDCILGMPFIIAFHGDPAKTFYCADYPTSYELIPRTGLYPMSTWGPWGRLKQYLDHHVTQLHNKVLIYKAG